MADKRILTNDDERVALAIELGWDVHAPEGGQAPADEYFQLDTLTKHGYGDALAGVDQPLLDEVREAAVRRQQQSAPPAAG